MTEFTKKPKREPRPPAVSWTAPTMPTMNDVARVSGFSQMTVSRAFLDASSIRKETRDRILKVASEIGYFHNKTASSLASRRLRAFGIILPTLQDSIYLPFVSGARTVFERLGADYLLQSIDYARKREPEAIASLLSQRVQAILLPSIGHTRETGKLLRAIPIPLIEVGNLPKRPLHFAVGHSDFDAGYMATKRLIDIGRRRIAILCGYVDSTSNARDRLDGYRRAMSEAGLAAPERLIAQTEHAIDAGLESLGRLLESGARFDGLVVAGEIWSSAVLLAILRKGRRIPDDIALIGVGEVELGPYLPVSMSFVALPRRDTGVAAAELAVSLSRGEPIEHDIVKLPVKLMTYASA